MNRSLIDTDILSEVLRGRNSKVVACAQEYLATFPMLTVSSVSVMEIVCGYQRVQRLDRVSQFLQATASMEIIPFDLECAALAGRIDGDLWRTGQRIGRADPMIAAQAIVHQLVLVSGNIAHYQRIQALGYPLQLDNWRESVES